MASAADVATWATSGAMALTGIAGGPPRAEPAGVVTAASAAAADVSSMTARFGHAVEIDGPALLAERAAIAGFGRNGAVSVGGAARFERCADGWVVLNLPRPSDVASLPALVEADVDPGIWSTVAARLKAMPVATAVDRARLLGLAVARPDERAQLAAPGRELSRGPVVDRDGRQPIVVDFSSLWAGPLAGSLLAAAGARVIKVEGRGRPDGARQGPADFFDLLNAGKEMVTVDFADRADRAFLRRLVAAADLVIEASRPRALADVGLHPTSVGDEFATSWLSITGHGRTDDPDRVAFGDDAAVAGGLWVDADEGPMFVGDAIADPLTGMAAAALGAELLASDRVAAVETPLARVAAWAQSRPTEAMAIEVDGGWWVEIEGERVAVAEPRGRRPTGRAAPIDAHGPAVRREFAER